MDALLRSKVDIECPICQRRISVTLGDVQQGRLVHCPGGHSVRLEEKGDGLKQAERSLKDFERSLKNLNRRLRI